MFGSTNQQAELDRCRRFRIDAIADGWTSRPTYGEHESEERHATLDREGFTMHVKARDNSTRGLNFKYEAEISIWGPDGLAIAPPDSYSWDKIKTGTRHCNECGADDVDTERYSFAGRACAACLPKARAIHEFLGWTE